MEPEGTVFVVDDDEALRDSLAFLMKSVGLPVQTFPRAEAFLASYDVGQPGCLLLDIRMPGMSGLDLQERLRREADVMPIIIISGHADVEQAVRALKTGAVDFIKKPYSGEVLVDRVREALKLGVRLRRERAEQAAAQARVALLTAREREILAELASGKPVKQIAFELALSRKTVDVHRGHIMTKLRVDSMIELARISELAAAAENAKRSDVGPG
jgi:two-component system response regulator FixJ